MHRIRDLGNRGAHSKKDNKKRVTSNDSKVALHQLKRLASLVVLSTDYKCDDAELLLSKYKNPTLIEFVNGYGDKSINFGSFTQEQLAFLGAFSDFLNDKSRSIFVLKGYAGSGKTYIIGIISQYLNFIKRNLVMCAPTGRATKVINKRLLFGEATTIHSQIYELSKIEEFKEKDENIDKKPQSLVLQNPLNVDSRDEKEIEHKIIFKLKENTIPSDCVYIFDESSMISDNFSDEEYLKFGSGKVLSDILDFVNLAKKEHNKKVLFIGDDAQLPPVNTDESLALNTEYLGKKTDLHITQSILQEIVRQENDRCGILNTAKALRIRLENNDFGNVYIDCNDDDLCKITHFDFLPKYLELYNKLGVEQVQVITHTNKNACKLNRDIRNILGKTKPLEIGDRLVVMKNCYNSDEFIANGEFLTLINMSNEIEQKRLPLYGSNKKYIDLSFMDVEVEDSNKKRYSVKIIYSYFENLSQDKEMPLERDITKALYIDFKTRFEKAMKVAKDNKRDTFYIQGYNKEILIEKYNKSELFKMALLGDTYFNALRVAFGYVVTCHKAQGGEWREVFINCNAGMNKKEYTRWLYTAITRAKDRVYLLDPPKKRMPLPF